MAGITPTCSVVIPTYNRMALLRRTLDALTRQDIGTDAFEVLVVDDGSSDDTAAVVAQFHDRLNVRYFFQPDEGFRVAAARNVGIAHARSDIVVFLDSGVLAHSGCLRAHLRRHAVEQPAAVIGYVYCFNFRNEDAGDMTETLDFDDVDGTIARLRREGRWLDVREGFYTRIEDRLRDLPAPWLMYWTCNVSARTGQVRAVGGFDEKFRTWGSEDIDLAYRLHQDGAVFLIDRDAGAIHYPHPKLGLDKAMATRNWRYIADKYDTPITRLLADGPATDFFAINDIIRERGLPSCAEYRAARAGASTTSGTTA
ncbi:glycosyltransferase [Micromonospora sp. KC606]|uniref:glycosyltransferase family 2 protein n=1 Tax=Micromonospora sp. KC606 TaxID=2530379 RepID=UPI001044A9CF|nr:glycosyltransferase family 2 protein [Micromonospora sp. KC606]TDC82875.1 glycosyltransferase [Micromonospora sp. KC606]